MDKIRACNTPQEGWELFGQFLTTGLHLLMVDEVCPPDKGTTTENDRSQLVGNLYMVVRRMERNLHEGDTVRMREILEMVADGDLTDPKVREAIRVKHEGFAVLQEAGLRVLQEAARSANAGVQPKEEFPAGQPWN